MVPLKQPRAKSIDVEENEGIVVLEKIIGLLAPLTHMRRVRVIRAAAAYYEING